MKSIFKTVFLIAAASLTLNAFAGDKPGRRHDNGHGTGYANSHGIGHDIENGNGHASRPARGHESGRARKHNNGHGTGYHNRPQMYPYYELIINGYEGSLGSQVLTAFLYCDEFPDPENVGQLVLQGGASVGGNIATDEYISVSEGYEGLDACPVNETAISKNGNQSISISVGGIFVSADCSGQIIERKKYKVENKYPGQAKWETYEKNGLGNISDYEELVGRSCTITAMDSSGNTETFTGINATASIRKGFRRYY